MLATKPRHAHCQCAACERTAELLDVLEALQISGERDRRIIADLTRELNKLRLKAKLGEWVGIGVCAACFAAGMMVRVYLEKGL